MADKLIPPVGSVAAICEMQTVELAQYLNSRGIDLSLSQAQVEAALSEAVQNNPEAETITMPRQYFLHCAFLGIMQYEGKDIFEG